MGQSELIEKDILYIVLSLVFTLPFVKSPHIKINGNNTIESSMVLWGVASTSLSTPEITGFDHSFFSWLGRERC